MKQFLASDIRNFAIVGHGASGKTCLAEAMIKIGGCRKGAIHFILISGGLGPKRVFWS